MRFAIRLLLLILALGLRPVESLAEDSAILFEPTSQIPAEGGPEEKVAFLPGGTGLLSGGIGALDVGNGISLGVGGYTLASEYVPVDNGIKHDMGYTYGGLVVDDSFFTRRLFYIRTSLMVGPAQAWSLARFPGSDRVYVNFAQIEPGIDVMLNVTHELRLGVGLGWRLCAGADLDRLLGSDLSGGSLSFVMMYGKI